MNEIKLIAIVGETASGKSSLAMNIAKKWDGEIVSADSWQIYKCMDIGTAKPTEREQTEVKHHLIDLVEPDEDFTAAQYKKLAEQAIEDIQNRGKLPVIVGGTGLYVDSVLFDYSFLPAGTKKQRKELNSKSISELLEILDDKDISTNGIDTRNKRRLVRLIETQGQRPKSREDMLPGTLAVGIKLSRTKLRSRMEKRVESMFAKGLKYEVKKLINEYGWSQESMKGIGYREWKDYFEGEQSLQATKRKILKSTLKLAKRQRTWFKRNRGINWFSSKGEALEFVDKQLS